MGGDGKAGDLSPKLATRANNFKKDNILETKREKELKDVSSLDAIAIAVAVISTLNCIFFILVFPLGSYGNSGGLHYTLCSRVHIGVVYATIMIILQHRLFVLYIRDVNVDFLMYEREFKDVSEDLTMLLNILLPDGIKNRMMLRMQAVLQGDTSLEEVLPALSQFTPSEQEIAFESHDDEIELSFRDISLISQMQSSVIGTCITSDLVQPKITSDMIVFRLNVSMLERVKLTL